MRRRRWQGRARLGVLSVVAFYLAHDILFLLSYGSSWQALLARTGHGDRWIETMVVVFGLAAALAVAGVARLVVLARLARQLDGGQSIAPTADLRALVPDLRRAWLVILPVSVALFVAGENIERLAIGLPAPGLDVVGTLGPAGMAAVFSLVALGAALVDALYRWRRAVLVARIDAARRCWARSTPSPARPTVPWVEPRHSAVVGLHIAGRAPPAPSGG